MSTALISLLAYCANAQVSGTVFKDFNMDGTKGTASPNLDVGMAGVVVKATKPDGTTLTVSYTGGGTSTNTTGAYTVTGGTAGQIRLEFVMPDSYTFASKGAAGGTTVMFPSGTTQNLAVNYPADYCGVADPMLVTSCYVGNNAAGMNDVLVKYAYSSSGPSHSASHTTIGVKSEMGSVWGIAYDRQKQDLFVGAFVKRHIALKDNNSDGKEDIGAIYIVPSSGSPSLWLDVTTLGVDVGMSLMPTIATRALPVPVTTSDLAASHDTQLYSLVGKIGLGDIEISDDNTQLFFVNLYDSKIYTVDIATKALVGSGIAVPNSCTGGNARPFALTYHRGKLYIGSVCDAATSKVDADMKATVYRLDGTTFTSVLSFPLNYTKGAAFTWGGVYGNKWNPWEDSFSNISGGISPTGLNLVCEPQPIFADIVFDTDESLIMVFNDRLGHQTGTANYQPSTSDTKLYYGLAGGDILRASLVSGVYTLEKNATSGGVTTAGAGNGQGPGTPTGTGYTSPSGEFYVGDDENNVHEEVVGGGAAIVPGRGQVVTQVSDPDQNYFAGGTYWFNNTTGEYDKSYVVFIDPSFGLQPWLFGKANGLGDMEVMCNDAPIEIGNRVWDDTDKDGIQDAGEAGIQNVSVTLCDKNGTPISGATATTDANGNYFFSSASGTNSSSAKYGLSLTYNTDYILKFPTTSGTKSLTSPNLGGNDLVDSDAAADGKIAFTTGYAGENNHSFDVGYSTCTKPTLGTTVTTVAGTCTGSTPNNDATASLTVTGGDKADIIEGATYGSGPAYNAASNKTVTAGSVSFTGLKHNTQYTIRVWNADNTCFEDKTFTTPTKDCSCTTPVLTDLTNQTICVGGSFTPSNVTTSVTNGVAATYLWYNDNGTTNPTTTVISGQNTATLTALPTAAGVYKYRVEATNTADNTCKASKSVTLTITANPAPTVNSPTICSGQTATLTVANCAGTVTWSGGLTGNPATTPALTSSTTYTATCTVGTCTGTAVATVTVSPNPAPTVNSPTICSGQTATLTVANCAGTVTWSGGLTGNPATTPALTSSTTYTATCTVGTCTGTAVATVTVSPNPAPTVNSPMICSGQTATLTVANCAGTVTWSGGLTGNPATTPALTSSTTYTATCTVGTCTGTAVATVTVSPNPAPTVNSPMICSGQTATLTVANCAGTVTWSGGLTGNPATTPALTSSTTYTATCTVGTCTGTAAATVTVSTKPAPTVNSPTICSGQTATLTVANCSGTVTWSGGLTGNPATTPALTSSTTYTATCTVGTCTGTAAATVTVSTKPNAGKDTTMACLNPATNQLATSITLAPIPTGGSWTQIGTTPATATINGNAVTNMTVAGTYQFVYTTTAGCKDTVAVTVSPCAGCTKPDAGLDVTLTCPPSGIAPTTATLAAVTSGGTWGAIVTNPAAATINAATGAITGLTTAGTYRFVYSVTGGGNVCTDTAAVIVPTCVQPKGSLGDFVWKDQNNNGIQDETTPNGGGVAGVQIELYKNGTFFAKDTTDVQGKYLFTNLDAGTYKIKVLAASIPAGCELSSVTDAPSDDAKDSDVDKTTGESGNYEINPLDPTKKDILTVDAALVVPCVKSKVTLTGAPVCSADVQTYSITFSVTNKVGNLKVNKGTLTGANPYTVTGIPSGATIKITDSLSAVCKFDTLITGPNCNCNPPLPLLITPSMTACVGDTFPTIKATVVGLATVEWFTQPTGGTAVFTGLNYKPSGTVPTTGAVFYAQARSTDPTCPTAISTSRVMATVNAQDCTKEVDLALKKSINTKIAQIGDVLTYTLKVWNESNTNATGVEVTDSIATTVEFQAGSFTASRGSAVISGNVIKWTIGNIAAAGVPANGDTVTLTYKVKATQQGIHYNTAEISKTNEKDVDSTPSNGKETEDDIDRQCFTVPIKLCSGNKVEVTVPTRLTNVKWYRNGGSTPIATGNVVLLSEIGTYTFTADNGTCPTGGCCPVILESDTNCCPAEACVPFTVKKIKK
ncbi:SdrD B-like domain-containing protein [Runella rosea]|nr:SdrD B-like domain-containing protein [Runella rosea]